ncbi:MAG: ribonuclease P protein component [Methyloglobulus sp.]|nr:ribonuclease P protein component [Pseudomonadota bacterium]MSS76482.1 ribonuclease P protein component [Methyloglobulus sp.]
MTELNYSFPPKLRLKKAAEFKNVFSNPVKSTDRYFTLLATQSDFDNPRVGLAIAKKIIRKAVHRNVIKRTIRESFRIQQYTMTGIDIVVLARKDALGASPDELRLSLEKHWLKLVSKCASC